MVLVAPRALYHAPRNCWKTSFLLLVFELELAPLSPLNAESLRMPGGVGGVGWWLAAVVVPWVRARVIVVVMVVASGGRVMPGDVPSVAVFAAGDDGR